MMPGLDLAAELLREQLLAVADGQHGNARVEDVLRRARRPLVRDRARAAGKDHRLRRNLRKGLLRALKRRDLAIDARLAHAPRDELRDLRAEVDDEHLIVTLGDVVGESRRS